MYKTVVLDGDLSLTINGSAELSLDVLDNGEFGAYMALRDGALPEYTGEKVVVPKAFRETVLETAGKSIYDNIRVLEIPYEEVSNEAGGHTINIAGSVGAYVGSAIVGEAEVMP